MAEQEAIEAALKPFVAKNHLSVATERVCVAMGRNEGLLREFSDLVRVGYEADPEGFRRRSRELHDRAQREMIGSPYRWGGAAKAAYRESSDG